MLLINFMMIICSIILIFMTHPISMGSILLMQTIFTCLIIGLININYWYSYILFLIMIGSLLILFIYMTSIASNEKFRFSNKLFLLIMQLMFLMSISILISDYYFINLAMLLNNMSMNFFIKLNFLFINKYINMPSNLIFISTILYLLISLIASIKISSTFKGPLRQNN